MKTLKPGPRTEILADIAKAAKELKEDFAELIKSIQTSNKNFLYKNDLLMSNIN
jgi:hypothetical protein